VRVVEVVSRKRWAPIFKHPPEMALGDKRLRQVLRHIGQAEAGQRRIEVPDGYRAMNDREAIKVMVKP